MNDSIRRFAKKNLSSILEALDAMYPLAECTLDYSDPFELLISTRLAAQCTDARVNLVTPKLFEKYPDCEALSKASQSDVEDIIRSTGFFRAKAENIIACSKRLCEEYGGVVPDTMEDLISLPGVGRKTANLVLGEVFHKPSYVVDTHCMRVTKRIGLTDGNEPIKIEYDLREIIPPEKSGRFCHQMVLHGRAVCDARRPMCSKCDINTICRKNGVKSRV